MLYEVITEVKLVLKPKKAGTTSFEIGNSDTGEKFTLAVTYAEPVIVDENELTAKEIYALCSKSVVQVNTDLGFGSGFFIESNLIVTNVITSYSIHYTKLYDSIACSTSPT